MCFSVGSVLLLGSFWSWRVLVFGFFSIHEGMAVGAVGAVGGWGDHAEHAEHAKHDPPTPPQPPWVGPHQKDARAEPISDT